MKEEESKELPLAYRDRTIEFFDSEITITQRFGGPPSMLGDHLIWDAALVLIAHLESYFPREFWRGKHVLELGAGCGTVSIALSKCNQTMWICMTDQEPLLDLMEKNKQQNSSSVVEFNFLSADSLAWPESGHLEPMEAWLRCHEYAPFDIVLMSDCVYPDRREWVKLRDAMLAIANVNKNTLFIMSHELRSHEDRQFFVEIEDEFVLSRIPMEDIPLAYRSDDIAVFHMRKK
jgi:predicted nicotinamide N-methyase